MINLIGPAMNRTKKLLICRYVAALWLRPLITEKPVDFSVIRTQIVV